MVLGGRLGPPLQLYTAGDGRSFVLRCMAARIRSVLILLMM